MVDQTKDTFHNSSRRLYLCADGTPPVYTLVPTLVFDETPTSKEDTWWSSADVVNGVAYEGGTVTGQGKAYRVETKMFKTADATPALNSALSTIRACKNQSGMAARNTFIIVEPDGTAEQCDCDVLQVITIKGRTEDSAAMTFELHRRGAPVAFTGTLPDATVPAS